jgi:phosphatidyl-myo-inositol dimannoside synthase
LRVLLISQGFPKSVTDSTAPFMAAIVRSLVGRGHLVDVVLPYHPDFRYPAGEGFEFFPYRYSPADSISPWGFGGSLKGSSRVSLKAALFLPAVVLSLRHRVTTLLSAVRYDVVHAHWLLPNGWVAAGAATRKAIPIVITLHGSDVAIAERVPLLRHLARSALSVAGAVTTVSDDLRRRSVRLGADPTTTRTVHLGVDTNLFTPHDVAPSVRARLGAEGEVVLIVAVGRLMEVKGFQYLIEAVSRLDGVHLAIIGDGDLRGDLEAVARSSKASVTLTGNLDQPAVSDAMAAADIVVVPSVVSTAGNVDGLPTTLLEALSTGSPVVASAVAGIPEVVTNCENGLLVPEKDVDALSRALAELRDQPAVRDRLGAEARRRALSELNWNAVAEAFEQAYRSAGATQLR